LIVAVLSFLFISVYYNFPFGLGLFLGTVWGCLNLFFISQLIIEAISLKKPNKGKIILIFLVKFPLLYFVGYVLLWLKYLPVESLVVGFTLIFAVTFLKALGRLIFTSITKGTESTSNLNSSDNQIITK
jgi:hypothetical protein